MDSLSLSSSSDDQEAGVFALKLATATVLPAALRSAIELDLLELIKKAGPGAFVSPTELAAQIPNTNPEAHVMLDRVLRLLAANDILNCSLRELPHGGVERLYSLAPVCKFFTRNEDGASVAPMLLMNHDKIFMDTWNHLTDTIVGGGFPFNRAHGMNVFEYAGKDPRLNNLFNQAMWNNSIIFMKKIIDTYKGFEGLKSLVDVGGGIGVSINMIVSKYPSIKGINFDLPHVIEHAPFQSGVEHISGDMFVSIPKGDAIFMKWICHDWSDGDCLKILKNCHEALGENGKVIIAERILLEMPDKNIVSSSLGYTVDLLMLAYNTGGKERTEKEFQSLAINSGFKHFRTVCRGFSFSIMELHK